MCSVMTLSPGPFNGFGAISGGAKSAVTPFGASASDSTAF
jgi:hypothetical protein